MFLTYITLVDAIIQMQTVLNIVLNIVFAFIYWRHFTSVWGDGWSTCHAGLLTGFHSLRSKIPSGPNPKRVTPQAPLARQPQGQTITEISSGLPATCASPGIWLLSTLQRLLSDNLRQPSLTRDPSGALAVASASSNAHLTVGDLLPADVPDARPRRPHHRVCVCLRV